MARSYDPIVDWPSDVDGRVAFRADGVITTVGPMFVVVLQSDGDLDPYGFGTLDEAEAFATRAQKRFG